jgi:hypothetical protein
MVVPIWFAHLVRPFGSRRVGNSIDQRLATSSSDHDVRSIPQHDMQATTHDRKPKHTNREEPGQRLKPFLNPLAPVIKAVPGMRTRTTQKRPPDTPINAVVNPDFGFLNNILSRHTSHHITSEFRHA